MMLPWQLYSVYITCVFVKYDIFSVVFVHMIRVVQCDECMRDEKCIQFNMKVTFVYVYYMYFGVYYEDARPRSLQ